MNRMNFVKAGSGHSNVNLGPFKVQPPHRLRDGHVTMSCGVCGICPEVPAEPSWWWLLAHESGLRRWRFVEKAD